tara:strand:- start:3544 stop:4158 length:615 start_codon:yes stop_codon:yes gene_type:complete
MVYFLGRDVKVAITTEDTTHGVDISSATPDVAAASSGDVASGDVIEVLPTDVTAIFDSGSNYNPFTDVTGVDLTLGKIDEDIAYMGQRTALKAEIKNESTLVITKKKSNKFWDHVFMDARYGIGTDNALVDGLSQPGVQHGYRLYVALKDDGSEVITLPNCTLTEKTTSLNVDGTTEETLTFMTHVDPLIDTDVTLTATTTSTL